MFTEKSALLHTQRNELWLQVSEYVFTYNRDCGSGFLRQTGRNKEDAASVSRPSVVMLPLRCCCWHIAVLNAAILWVNKVPEVCPGIEGPPVILCPRKRLLSSRMLTSNCRAGDTARMEECLPSIQETLVQSSACNTLSVRVGGQGSSL